jgi:hypothetical protein
MSNRGRHRTIIHEVMVSPEFHCHVSLSVESIRVHYRMKLRSTPTRTLFVPYSIHHVDNNQSISCGLHLCAIAIGNGPLLMKLWSRPLPSPPRTVESTGHSNYYTWRYSVDSLIISLHVAPFPPLVCLPPLPAGRGLLRRTFLALSS